MLTNVKKHVYKKAIFLVKKTLYRSKEKRTIHERKGTEYNNVSCY